MRVAQGAVCVWIFREKCDKSCPKNGDYGHIISFSVAERLTVRLCGSCEGNCRENVVKVQFVFHFNLWLIWPCLAENRACEDSSLCVYIYIYGFVDFSGPPGKHSCWIIWSNCIKSFGYSFEFDPTVSFDSTVSSAPTDSFDQCSSSAHKSILCKQINHLFQLIH